MPGPFYFAWADANETTWSSGAHQVEDEIIFSFEIEHVEGDFAGLSIDIKNPKVGLLGPGRQIWAWLAWDNGTTVEPLFFGRLVGVPEELQDEVVRLTFVARPDDFIAQKTTLADTLKVVPFWDPIWIDESERDNPDSVLEARSALWHIDRTSHVVTISDLISGEDGTVVIGTAFYDSVSLSYSEIPVRKVKVTAKLFWDQNAIGVLDISSNILAAFTAANSTKFGRVVSYSGKGLQSDWPEESDNIGAGWEVASASAIRVDGTGMPLVNLNVSGTQRFGGVVGFTGGLDPLLFIFVLWGFDTQLSVRYDITRSRQEIVTFTLESDMQAIITDPGEDEVIEIDLSSSQLNEPIDAGDKAPIGDVRRRAYLSTDRGLDSLTYLISLARARLLSRARAVVISFELPFIDGIDLSCRKSVTLSDPRLPGGTATGKIMNYVLRMDGSTGQTIAQITMGCTIGHGNTVTPAAGSPDYVEVGYVETGFQTFTSKTLAPIAGEVTYTTFGDVLPNDDGIDFLNLQADQAIVDITIFNGSTTQEGVINDFDFGDAASKQEALNLAFTECKLDLLPLNGGPFITEYPITVSNLMVPKTIDLEAT